MIRTRTLLSRAQDCWYRTVFCVRSNTHACSHVPVRTRADLIWLWASSRRQCSPEPQKQVISPSSNLHGGGSEALPALLLRNDQGMDAQGPPVRIVAEQRFISQLVRLATGSTNEAYHLSSLSVVTCTAQCHLQCVGVEGGGGLRDG